MPSLPSSRSSAIRPAHRNNFLHLSPFPVHRFCRIGFQSCLKMLLTHRSGLFPQTRYHLVQDQAPEFALRQVQPDARAVELGGLPVTVRTSSPIEMGHPRRPEGAGVLAVQRLIAWRRIRCQVVAFCAPDSHQPLSSCIPSSYNGRCLGVSFSSFRGVDNTRRRPVVHSSVVAAFRLESHS